MEKKEEATVEDKTTTRLPEEIRNAIPNKTNIKEEKTHKDQNQRKEKEEKESITQKITLRIASEKLMDEIIDLLISERMEDLKNPTITKNIQQQESTRKGKQKEKIRRKAKANNITENKNIAKPDPAEDETNILKEKQNSGNNTNDPKQLLKHKITRIEPIKHEKTTQDNLVEEKFTDLRIAKKKAERKTLADIGTKNMNNNKEEHKNKAQVITQRYTDNIYEAHAPSKEKETHRQENSKVVTEKSLQESHNKNSIYKLDKSKHNSTEAESKEDEDTEQKTASNTWSNTIKATAMALTTLGLLYLDWPETKMESRSRIRRKDDDVEKGERKDLRTSRRRIAQGQFNQTQIITQPARDNMISRQEGQTE